MQVLTTDEEITTAITAWLEARPALSRDDVKEPIARFAYDDGMGGSITRDRDADDMLRPVRFYYTLRDDDCYSKIAFTDDAFSRSRLPLIPLLHNEARRNIERLKASHPRIVR